MSETCHKCGNCDWIDAGAAGKDAAMRLKEFKSRRVKQETRARLGALGEGAFHHPGFRSTFASYAISFVLGGVVLGAIKGILTVTYCVEILALGLVFASIVAFATVSHNVQMEIQAETDSIAKTKRACRACGELQP